jgi:hypothetical protein
MGTSSHRVGPSYDTLRVVVQPWPSQVSYTVTRLHFEGSQRVDSVVGSGKLPVTNEGLKWITAVGLLDLVVEQLRNRAKPPAPPLGDMGEQVTLNLDLSA